MDRQFVFIIVLVLVGAFFFSSLSSNDVTGQLVRMQASPTTAPLPSSLISCSPGYDLPKTLIVSNTPAISHEPFLNGLGTTVDTKYIISYMGPTLFDRLGLYDLTNPSQIVFSELATNPSNDYRYAPDISSKGGVVYHWLTPLNAAIDDVLYRKLGPDNKIGTADDSEIVLHHDPQNCCGSCYAFSPKISDDDTNIIWVEYGPVGTPCSPVDLYLYIYDAGFDNIFGTADDVGPTLLTSRLDGGYHTSRSLSNTHVAWKSVNPGNIEDIKMTYAGGDGIFGTADDLMNITLATYPWSMNVREVQTYENGVAYAVSDYTGPSVFGKIYAYDFGSDKLPLTADDLSNVLLASGTAEVSMGGIDVKQNLLVYSKGTSIMGILTGHDGLFGTIDDSSPLTLQTEPPGPYVPATAAIKKTPLGYIITYAYGSPGGYYFIRRCL